jgi:uncharacterized protein (DUF427 family)
MSVRLGKVLGGQLDQLRCEPTRKRIRAVLDGVTVLDSEHAVLVWEPRRVVPSYAVPVADLRAPVQDAVPAEPDQAEPEPSSSRAAGFSLPDVTTLRVLDPRIPFEVHTTDGTPVRIGPAGSSRRLAGFRPSDPDLAEHVVLDFAGADWLEEDEPIVSHPRDPFHRVDVRDSSRHVQVLLDGHVLADTRRSRMVFETNLPVRYYLPPEDVTVPLQPSQTRTACAYKGVASYRSAVLPDHRVDDLVWCYQDPLDDAARLRGYLAFFDEKVDLVVDGEHRSRPVSPWS